ncbi:hypothetical protein FD525_07280 [Cutibacterium acnes]|nr:hypothetical protein HMPREF9566_00393 [Cutibacterium acnes HL045PA1]EGE95437.1 hypothetical protein HMPREF9570_00347 [Cutibacterium acnes HL043PA1]REL39935.1 hypothetical protein CJM40_08205 [Cutibacterium acnes]TLG05207.1 hypothetical protein FD525_07280 [Cutibacterium acnes]TLG06930.1 hypothetical protein FD519_07280 [Cutibacterium acnes]
MAQYRRGLSDAPIRRELTKNVRGGKKTARKTCAACRLPIPRRVHGARTAFRRTTLRAGGAAKTVEYLSDLVQ